MFTHVKPTFDQKQIFQQLESLGCVFTVPALKEHVCLLNPFCRIAFRLTGKTPFYAEVRMENFDMDDLVFSMDLRVYDKRHYAYATAIIINSRVVKSSFDTAGLMVWDRHQQINEVATNWLSVCTRSTGGPLASIFFGDYEDLLPCTA